MSVGIHTKKNKTRRNLHLFMYQKNNDLNINIQERKMK